MYPPEEYIACGDADGSPGEGLDFCHVCGAYWACGHWAGPPLPEPRYANLDLLMEGGTVAGYDLAIESWEE